MAIAQTYNWASYAATSGYSVYLEATETSYDVATNSSQVYLYAKLYPNQSTWASSQGCTLQLKWNGSNVGTAGYTTSLLSGQYVETSWSGTVYHNPDGKYSGTVSWYISAGGTVAHRPQTGSSGEHVLTLTDIPRKATVTAATDFNDEGNPTVTFSNPGNFTTKPYLKFYDSSNTLVHTITGTSEVASPYTWALTDAQRTSLRTATNKQKTYTVEEGIETFNGSTSLGTSSINKTA